MRLMPRWWSVNATSQAPAVASVATVTAAPLDAPVVPPPGLLAFAGDRLRQPLHALNLFAGSLCHDASPTQAPALRGIEASLRELARVVDELERSAGLLHEPLPVQLIPLPVGAMLETAARATAQGGVTVRWRTRDLCLLGDARLTALLVDALVGDAVRRARSRVLLAARRAGDDVRIEVRDDGEPLAPAPGTDALSLLAQRAGRDGAHDHVLALAVAARLTGLLGFAVTLRAGAARGNVVSVLVPTAFRVRAVD